jgi:flagellar biosynthesis protein FliR
MKRFKNFVKPVKAFLSIVIPIILGLLTIVVVSAGISLVTPATYADVISFPFIIVLGVVMTLIYLYITADWLFD